MRPRFEGKRHEHLRFRHVVLERRACRRRQRRTAPVQVPHEIAFAVAAHAVPQDVIVHPAADVERIDLDVAVVGQRRREASVRRIKAVCAPEKTTSGERCDVKRGRHGKVFRLNAGRWKKQGARLSRKDVAAVTTTFASVRSDFGQRGRVRGQYFRNRGGELSRRERFCERLVRSEIARVIQSVVATTRHGDDADMRKFLV